MDTAKTRDSSSAIIGLLTALVFNGLLGAGILLATHLRGDDIASAAEAEVQTLFQCRYIDANRIHQLEVDAVDWQDAEAKVCGAQFRDVRIPPLLAKGYSALIGSPDQDPILMAQRESCSCSENASLMVMHDIGIVEAPRLGTLPKQRSLPRIVNNPPPSERNAVDPDARAPEVPRDKERPKERKREPDLNKLLDATSNFDAARPANTDEAVGSPDGSRTSTSATGRGDPYLQKVKARLDNAMNAPASIPKHELRTLKSTVWIKIGANGAIWGWDYVNKSNSKAFDAMIERTIKRFGIGGDQSFPAPPAEWALKRIKISVDGGKIK